ncbi:hypothetical protein [Alicyclobacillus sp.]|uniref:hypothetical protein n=1 Tax=Alicyclobacillus sp. TaxID=61169 RepID=UPI0025C360B2|nr:hypothetical protein [Alicyclobacillus sp.]MCL6515997.1 hypothetical protein [Alicyclobacillus sp.]
MDDAVDKAARRDGGWAVTGVGLRGPGVRSGADDTVGRRARRRNPAAVERDEAGGLTKRMV